jgi:hypothetical protein
MSLSKLKINYHVALAMGFPYIVIRLWRPLASFQMITHKHLKLVEIDMCSKLLILLRMKDASII